MRKITKNSIVKQICSLIEKVPEVALFSHVSPDGDSLGSMLALGTALETLDKKVLYYNAGPLPDNLKFLSGYEKIKVFFPQYLPDTVIFLDCAEVGRADSQLDETVLAGKQIVNIDHHISNNNFGTLNWVDPHAAATGEMIYYLIRELGVKISVDIAEDLYTAIITDTGRFSYSNTTPTSFRITAGLVKTGIDLVKINNILFEQKTIPQIRLLHKALSNLQILSNGKIAVIVLSQGDFAESGADECLSEGLINYAKNIKNVEAAVLLKELDNDEIRVSFRSNFWLDVNKVASRFGGGGHVRASGCTIHLPLAEAAQTVLSALEEALNIGRNH